MSQASYKIIHSMAQELYFTIVEHLYNFTQIYAYFSLISSLQ